MKYATWLDDQREVAGILSADFLSVHPFKGAGLDCDDMIDFIEWHTRDDIIALETLARTPGKPIGEVRLLAPIPRPRHDVICLGLNYRDHEKEAKGVGSKMAPEHSDAVYFSKRVAEAVGPEGEIESHTDLITQLDYEVELAFVMKNGGRNIPREDAWSHVFGLMCFNDVSGRDAQFRHGQWYFGKSLDGFTAYGPYISSIDEFSLPLRLRVCSRINGEPRQDGNTADMIYPIDYVIAELSQGITLDAGTIVATGTPAGVGVGFNPPKTMKPGDICEIEIEGCGILRNTVK